MIENKEVGERGTDQVEDQTEQPVGGRGMVRSAWAWSQSGEDAYHVIMYRLRA